ncbi:unnamed protein product [Cuscuta campestris]|uniref:Uncharacterized protein n=1 Tax=Cuscuta campestris TaxID=132261 RepID=A0A484N982_9ASTE|nr:unnamed protein product [Cuscuta campestris]
MNWKNFLDKIDNSRTTWKLTLQAIRLDNISAWAKGDQIDSSSIEHTTKTYSSRGKRRRRGKGFNPSPDTIDDDAISDKDEAGSNDSMEWRPVIPDDDSIAITTPV